MQVSESLEEAGNYAATLKNLDRFKEARSLLRKTLPVAWRVLGEDQRLTLKMRKVYAEVLYEDPDATLDDLREVVTRLEDLERIARRVLGSSYPLTKLIEQNLPKARKSVRDGEAYLAKRSRQGSA